MEKRNHSPVLMQSQSRCVTDLTNQVTRSKRQRRQLFLMNTYPSYLLEICLVFFAFSFLAVRSSLARSIQDIAAYEALVLVGLGRNIQPVRRGLVDATARKIHEYTTGRKNTSRELAERYKVCLQRIGFGKQEITYNTDKSCAFNSSLYPLT